MHPLLEHAVDKTVELLAEKPVELLTGLLLVAVTFLLFKATKDLARATNVLAQSTTEESRNRRIQATADAWMKIRPELELPDLTGASESAINAAREEVLPQLRKLEAFAELINA